MPTPPTRVTDGTEYEPVAQVPGPELGADTRQILTELGYSEADIAGMISSNVVLAAEKEATA